MRRTPIHKYLDLIQRFTRQEVSIKDFEGTYLAMFKAETGGMSEMEFLILDRLFSDTDAYTDILPLGEFDINEDQLRECARAAYEKLTHLERGT